MTISFGKVGSLTYPLKRTDTGVIMSLFLIRKALGKNICNLILAWDKFYFDVFVDLTFSEIVENKLQYFFFLARKTGFEAIASAETLSYQIISAWGRNTHTDRVAAKENNEAWCWSSIKQISCPICISICR